MSMGKLCRLIAVVTLTLTCVSALAQAQQPGHKRSPAAERILAAERGETLEVEALLKGNDPNARDKPTNRTALMWTIIRKDQTAFDRLIAIPGADVTATDRRDETAIVIAAQIAMKFDTTAMVEALLTKGADPRAPGGGFTPLLHAANSNRPGVARAILAKLTAQDLEARNPFGQTALGQAAWVGAAEIVTMLLDKGANIEAADLEGKTPLLNAAGHVFPGTLETVRILVAGKADVNARDKAGNTPLSEAIKHGAPGVAELLKQSGAK
jgi:uncharacterized protein